MQPHWIPYEIVSITDVLDPLARLADKVLSQFPPTLQSKDCQRDEYEVKVRKLKAANKDRWQIQNCDMHLRLSLADTDDEKALLQEELATKRWNITEFQNIRLEQLRCRDYEIGKLTQQAVWDTILRFNERTKIYTLKSGRQVFAEIEAITITHAAEIAIATANAVNRKKFCSGQKVLRPNSYIPDVFDRGESKVYGENAIPISNCFWGNFQQRRRK